MKIINNFPVSIGKICFMSALADILNFYEYDLNESDLFGLCEGNLFYYGGLKLKTEGELEKADLLRVLRFGGMKYEIMQMINVLEDVLGFHVEGFEAGSETDVKDIVKFYIDQGIPLLSLVLRYYLEYSPGYQRDNFSHAVTVYGYDFDYGQFYVTDTFVITKPVSNYKGTLSVTNFRKALDLKEAVFEMPAKERILAVNPCKICKFDSIPVSIINKSLGNMAKNNLQGKMLQNDIFTGVQALRKFTDDFGRWQYNYQPEFLRRYLHTLHSMITNYGGPYITCELLCKYLQKIYNREKHPVYKDLADGFSEIRRLWLIIGNMCFKASLGEPGEICKRIMERLTILALKKEALYVKMAEFCNI